MVLTGRAAEYGISKATEERVRRALVELGYVPNIAAQSLRGGRTRLIGIHTFEALFPVRQDSYYHEFMVGIEEKAIELGQDLVLVTSTHQLDGKPATHRGGLNRLRLTDGAVILGLNPDVAELERLVSESFAFVFIGRRADVANLGPYVTAGYAEAIEHFASAARSLGHTRAAYLGLDPRHEPQLERLEAFRSSCLKYGISTATVMFERSGGIPQDSAAAIFESGATLLFVESATHLVKLSEHTALRGRQIPSDLSVVCLDTPASDEQTDWSHLVVPRMAMGARAVEILIAFLNGTVTADYFEKLPCPIAMGSTLAEASAAK